MDVGAAEAKLQGRPASVGEFTHRGQFDILKELHQSSNGSVHLARVKGGCDPAGVRQVILKRRRVAELGKAKDMLNEYELLKNLEHPNIIRCYGYFWEHASQSLFLVLEYANRGDLHAELQERRQTDQHFSDDEVWNIFNQILLGAAHVHSKGIVHRDIKSLNLLLNDTGVVKLGDFGVSRQMSEQTLYLNSFYGTPLYLSPELIEGQPYSQTTDVWSLGVVLYELLTLQRPFTGSCLQEVIGSVLRCQYSALPRFRSPEFGVLVAEMLTKEAQRRPSTANLVQRLEQSGRLSCSGPGAADPATANTHTNTSAVESLGSHRCSDQRHAAVVPSSNPNQRTHPRRDGSSDPKDAAALPAEAHPEGGFMLNAGQAAGSIQVIRVRRKSRPSSAAPQAQALAEPRLHDFSDDEHAARHALLNQLGQAVTPAGAKAGSAGGKFEGVQRSLARDIRWEERRHAHVVRVTRHGSVPPGGRNEEGSGAYPSQLQLAPATAATPKYSPSGVRSGASHAAPQPDCGHPSRNGGGGYPARSARAVPVPPRPPQAAGPHVDPETRRAVSTGDGHRRAQSEGAPASRPSRLPPWVASPNPLPPSRKQKCDREEVAGGRPPLAHARYDIIGNRWIEG